jgi:hypothetical protein
MMRNQFSSTMMGVQITCELLTIHPRCTVSIVSLVEAFTVFLNVVEGCD